MAEHRVLVKKMSEEEKSMLNRFIDVLDKTCESKFIYTTEYQREDIEKHNYILRRALVEFKQLIKEKAIPDASRCSNWLWRLEMELKYSFLQLVPFMETRLDVLHDDFVSVVHNAERSMEDYSDEQIHESFKEKFVAVDTQMLNDLPCCLEDIARLMLREWACTAGTGGDIACPSNSALSVISLESAKEYGETGLGLKRWMDEKVFPLLLKKLEEDVAVAENLTIFIETEGETGGELLFRLESPCCSRSPTDCCRTIFQSFLFFFNQI